jgi:type I restriction enzyme S subunit
MSWKSAKLTAICNPKQWKIISQNELYKSGYPVYGANGKMGFFNEYNHEEPVLLIGCRGTCGSIHISEPKSYTNGNAMACDNLDSTVNIKYLKYFFEFRGFKDIVSGGVQPQITIQNLSRVEIPLPPLSTQKRIAEILDAADALRRKDQELLRKYDELAQAIFIDMIGDPVKNEKYKRAPLSDVSEITNGVTKNGKLEHAEMITAPYMRVANVQDGYLDLKEIKDIRVAISDYYKYQLKKMDILLTEGGDPDKLGRGCIWMEEVPNSIFQNHLFRVRVNSPEIRPYYLAKLIGSKYGKKYFLKAAKQTTGIATINSSQLKAFPVIIPALNIQEEFERVNSQIDKVRSLCELNLAKSNQLFNSLLQQAFKGELVK